MNLEQMIEVLITVLIYFLLLNLPEYILHKWYK